MDAVKEKKNYSELKGEREFFKYLISDVITRFGDSLDSIAYSWITYSLTGSASLTAITYGVNYLVTVLLQPFTGSFVTNLNQKAVLVITDIIRALIVLSTAVLYATDLLRPWMLIFFTVLISTSEAFHQPVLSAVFPRLVPREKYTPAASLNGAASRAAEIIGMALAGTVIGVIGIVGALIIDAITFITSLLIISTIKIPENEKEKEENSFKNFKKLTVEGFKYSFSNKMIVGMCFIACAINFFYTPINSLQTAFVNEGLQLGVEALSIIGVSITAGMFFGSLLYPKISTRATRHTMIFGGISVTSLILIAYASLSLLGSVNLKWVLLVSVMVLFGFFNSLVNTSLRVGLMQVVEPDYMARVSGLMGAVSISAIPVASFAVALSVEYIKVPIIIAICGGISFIIMAITSRIKTMKNI